MIKIILLVLVLYVLPMVALFSVIFTLSKAFS